MSNLTRQVPIQLRSNDAVVQSIALQTKYMAGFGRYFTATGEQINVPEGVGLSGLYAKIDGARYDVSRLARDIDDLGLVPAGKGSWR